ncbi:MAG TPA: site-specific DNA-methyltransferase [Bryobacteraceae bacterium]|nr:site-specific DNA-methyltransferase [Bryobacteraceae bacterium]
MRKISWRIKIEFRPVSKLKPFARNARTHSEQQVDQIAASIQEFGWTNPILIDGNDGIIAGHARLLAAQKLGMTEVPVIVLDHLTPAQRKALVLADNKLALNAGWDENLLRIELEELQSLDFNLDLTGFASIEIDELLRDPLIEERADEAPPLPEIATARLGDVWLLGKHRVLCGDATSDDAVARLLNGSKPLLMATDPPYGVELDSEWRDRAGINKRGPAEPSYMKHRIEGHTQTKISGDTIADWSPAFELVPSLQVAYVWHASRFTSEVLSGLLRIGFIHHQQLIWRKTQAALTRTHYWFSHEPCWYVRKKNAHWYGRPGENTTVWDAASPKMIMGGSDETKFDHPTQKPVELMRRPILNHLKRGELVYDPFLGSGTTVAAAEVTERVCYGLELDPKYVDVVILRWQELTGQQATLEADGRTFAQIKAERLGVDA